MVSYKNIGIAITEHNRPDVFRECFATIKTNAPKDAVIEVIDDASDEPLPEATYRFDTNVGIARAKNKCLELLYDKGVEHFFLLDSDVKILSPDVWEAYINAGQNHLMYIFSGKGNQTRGINEIARTDKYIAYDHIRGCFLYANRKVIDTVGGFDTQFGRYYGEHTDWTARIHKAGLAPHKIMDIHGSSDYIYALDERGEATSTITRQEWLEYQLRNKQLAQRLKNEDRLYVPYED